MSAAADSRAAAVPVYLDPRAQADALAAALGRLGFTARRLTGREHQHFPCVAVAGGTARRVKEPGYVYAAPDEGGAWHFWITDPGDPLGVIQVAPLSEVPLAADAADRLLASARAVFVPAG